MLLALLPTGHHHLVCYQHEVGGGNWYLLLECAHTGAHLGGPQLLLPCNKPRFVSAGVLQVKMRELGVSTHQDYKLTCMLDHKAMITVQTEKYGGYPACVGCCSRAPCSPDCPEPQMRLWLHLQACLIANHWVSCGANSLRCMARTTPSCSTTCEGTTS